jgi:hypothetical protein
MAPPLGCSIQLFVEVEASLQRIASAFSHMHTPNGETEGWAQRGGGWRLYRVHNRVIADKGEQSKML